MVVISRRLWRGERCFSRHDRRPAQTAAARRGEVDTVSREGRSAATLREEERGSPLISGVQGGGENPRKLCGTSLRR
jgi:hypothetical protein